MANTAAAEKDSATPAQGRFVVSLPADMGALIDQIGEKLAQSFEKETGVRFELSRAQIVQALVRQALNSTDDS